MANPPLPEADAATTAAVKDWLARFAACVREVDYQSAQPFWHDAVVIFGKPWRVPSPPTPATPAPTTKPTP